MGARRAFRYPVLLIVLGLAVHLLLPQVVALEHSSAVLRSMNGWAVGAAGAAQVLSYVGSGYLLRAIARLFGHRLPLRRAITTMMASASLGLLWGGQLMNTSALFRWMRTAGLPAEGALLTGSLPPLINVFTLCGVSAFGLVYLLALHALSRTLATGFVAAIGLIVLVGGVLEWGMRHRPVLTRVSHAVIRQWVSMRGRVYDPARVDRAIGRLFDAGTLLRRGGWRGPLVGDALNVGFDMLTLFLLFVAAGDVISPGVLLAGYGLPLLLGKLTFLPGGVGVVEASMAALYGLLGVPGGVLVVVIIAYRLLSFWLPVALGFPMAIYLDRLTPVG